MERLRNTAQGRLEARFQCELAERNCRVDPFHGQRRSTEFIHFGFREYDMSELQDPPKIEFPCPNYPIKVIGRHEPGFEQFVKDVFADHAAGFDPSAIECIPSKKGNYCSYRLQIEARDEAQLRAIFNALKAHPATQMVL